MSPESIAADRMFARVHKSHIVNLTHISRIVYSRVVMNNGQELPIGDSYAEDLVKKLNMI